MRDGYPRLDPPGNLPYKIDGVIVVPSQFCKQRDVSFCVILARFLWSTRECSRSSIASTKICQKRTYIPDCFNSNVTGLK